VRKDFHLLQFEGQKMKVPKTIWVKGEEYTITSVSDLIDADDSDAQTSECEKTIKYDSSLKGKKLKRAMLHEIGHAIQYETGISQAASSEMQEIITENFANVFDDLFHWRFK